VLGIAIFLIRHTEHPEPRPAHEPEFGVHGDGLTGTHAAASPGTHPGRSHDAHDG
jgi:hypothetical protein